MGRRICQILVLALLLGGAGCVVWGALDGPVPAGWLPEMNIGPASGAAIHLVVIGSLMFLLAGLIGLMGMWVLGRDVGRVREWLGEVKEAGFKSQGSHVLQCGREFRPLVSGIEEVLRAAQTSVANAALKVKELEIQWKVANAERQHAEAIIYSISDAVLVTDPFDELVLANESAAKTFEFKLAEANRLPIDQVLRDPKMIELIRDMREASEETRGQGGKATRGRTGERRVVEHRMRTPMGDRTYKITLSSVGWQGSGLRVQDSDAISLNGEPSGTSNPCVGGVVVVLHDMTREKEVAQIKSDFVSHVSHELRTPLASIKAYVEMLIDGEAEDEKTQREFYEVIQNEANRLNRLIDNILNISRIESGLVQINKQPVSLPGIIADAVEVILPQARMKQIKVDQQLTPAFYQVMADRDMLYQSVMNLLSNAVKYTPQGGSVTVTTVVDEEAGKVVTRISDTGVGIPPKDLPFVFDKFYRVESNNRVAKGTGLGLSLVKHIVEGVHQGRIWVESEVGKGSSFSFELEVCD